MSQVTLDPLIPVKSLNQIKSVLVSVLASHGQLSEALPLYEEIKQAGLSLEPKDVMSLIVRFCEYISKFIILNLQAFITKPNGHL